MMAWWRAGWLLVAGAVLWAPLAGAQGVGFLTEQERLASYCAGVSEARLREMSTFLKTQCLGSNRRECHETAEALESARLRDRRLWDYLTRQIIASHTHGPRERALSVTAIAKGSNDWLACRQRDSGTAAEALLACRESQGCGIDARFGFLDP